MNVTLPIGKPAVSPRREIGVAKASVETAFMAISIKEGLFPAEFLHQLASPERASKSEGYGVPPGRTLRDEIGRYWTIAEALWREYKRDLPRADLAPERTGIERWLARLFREVLGYSDLARTGGLARIADRSFPITHRSHDGAVPVLLTISSRDLDRSHPAFGDDGRRRSPHAAMQEFLNAEAATLWGIVSNGLRLRLVRDNPSLTAQPTSRPTFSVSSTKGSTPTSPRSG